MMTASTKLSALFAAKHDGQPSATQPYDVTLILIALALMSIGVVIVTSASMPVADRLHDNPFYFAIRHGIYIVGAIVAAMVVLNLPMQFWRMTNPYLLLAAIALLLAVLVVGRTVNGSTRWLAIGPITIQAAEPAKLFFFAYLAGYLVRRYEEVTENLKGFIKPLVVFFALAMLLLLQPDLGTVVVMFATTIGLFPWADPFGAGYQLTQSLMAYGRGNWFGQGLGNSLQKLEFLPEAHTDFVMAILAEEQGFVGVLAVLGLILWMVLRALSIGNKALEKGRAFDGYMAYSIGIWFSFQTAVNIGASAGILPTKGLTLPLVSYGGSSLIIMSVAVAILLRIDFELRVDGVQAIGRGDSKSGKSKARRKKPIPTNESQSKAAHAESGASAEHKSDEADFSTVTVEAKPSAKRSSAEDEGKAGIKAILARIAQEADNG